MERRRFIQGGLAAALGLAAYKDMSSDTVSNLLFGPTPPSTSPYLDEPSKVGAAKSRRAVALHIYQTAIANGEDPKVATTLVNQDQIKEDTRLIEADPMTNVQSKAKQYRQKANDGIVGGYTYTPSQEEMEAIKLIAKDEQRQAAFEWRKTFQAIGDLVATSISAILAREAVR